ncbi:MAG: hypothetical protein HGA70_08180 [Chlorobiaceae bacterium]|nr:hypothetical protein [Chlorobiaceae bacterium]NTW10731.1 hypothetical protein [Chlorobiaceae bacterium]
MLFLLLFLPAVLLRAADARSENLPGVTVALAPDTVLVGDRVACTIRVHHREDETVTVEGIDSLTVKPSVLLGRRQASSAAGAGYRREDFVFELAVFSKERQSLPPFTVVLRNSSGRVTDRIPMRSSNTVFVRALTDSSMHEIRPIKPPVRPALPLLLLLPFFFSVFGLALAVLLLLFFLKRSVRRSAEKIDPGQVALRKLRKLSSRLSGGMSPRDCYEELSNILRSFLENRYRIRALEAVTQEIERDLEKNAVAGLDTVMNLLRQADLVKFADSRPELDDSRQSLQKAEEFVRGATRTEKMETGT